MRFKTSLVQTCLKTFRNYLIIYEKFLNFLFSLDLLPSYAFPRHVCSFQIEKRVGTFDRIEIVESPQQNLSTALTE